MEKEVRRQLAKSSYQAVAALHSFAVSLEAAGMKELAKKALELREQAGNISAELNERPEMAGSLI